MALREVGGLPAGEDLKFGPQIDLDYIKTGDYYIPAITVEDMMPDHPLGKYGMMRMDYVVDHKLLLYARLSLKGELWKHCCKIEDQANEMMDRLMPIFLEKAGATEELKMQDQLEWVRRYNSCQMQIDEIIRRELIYS